MTQREKKGLVPKDCLVITKDAYEELSGRSNAQAKREQALRLELLDELLRLKARNEELEAKNAELENFPHQLLDVNAICEERDRLKADLEEEKQAARCRLELLKWINNLDLQDPYQAAEVSKSGFAALREEWPKDVVND